MKIEKLLIYNTALRDSLHKRMAAMLNAKTPDNGATLVPYFEMVNSYLDQATIIERRIQFLERIKNDEESNNKQ
jgi:hypothetical protein